MKIVAYVYFPDIVSPTDPRVNEALRKTSFKIKKFGEDIGAQCWLESCDILDDSDILHVIF